MNLTRILIAVDALNGRDAAFNRALALAKSSGAELYVLYAVPRSEPFSTGGAERLERMAELRKRAEDIGVRVRTVEQHGDPAAIIELHANARQADLIVVGGEARRGWRRGSMVAERVLRRTSVPTLVIASEGPRTPTAFRSVLVAVDLSPASTDVLRAAVAMAADDEVELTVMHTASGVEAADAVQSRLIPEYRTHLLASARRALGAVVSAVPARVGTRLAVSTGSAARAILDHAAEAKADLVVMGRSRGLKVLGSTALRVFRKNDRALLVIPTDSERTERVQRPLAA